MKFVHVYDIICVRCHKTSPVRKTFSFSFLYIPPLYYYSLSISYKQLKTTTTQRIEDIQSKRRGKEKFPHFFYVLFLLCKWCCFLLRKIFFFPFFISNFFFFFYSVSIETVQCVLCNFLLNMLLSFNVLDAHRQQFAFLWSMIELLRSRVEYRKKGEFNSILLLDWLMMMTIAHNKKMNSEWNCCHARNSRKYCVFN